MEATPTAPPESDPPRRIGRTRRGRVSTSIFWAQLKEGMPRTWATWAVAGLCCAVYAAMLVGGASPLSPGMEDLLGWGADFGPLSLTQEPWRLVTSGFVHIGLLHLAINLWCLWIAGGMVERWIGHGGFAIVYLFALVVSSLVSIAWSPGIVSAGASGAVFGVLGAMYACMRALARTVPPQVFEDVRLVAGVFLVYNVIYGFSSPLVDNAAHVGGLIGGFVGAAALGRAHGDGEVRVPLLRLDLRFGVVLVAVATGAWFVASHRVRSSDAFVHYHAVEVEAAVMQDDYDAALGHLDQMIETAIPARPRDAADWHAHRCALLLQVERWPEALEAADRSIELAPDVAAVHASRSYALSSMRRFDGAAAAAERSIAMDPGLPHVFHQWLWCLSETERDVEFLRAAERAVERHPDTGVLHTFLAVALERAGRAGEALSAVERALELEPANEWSAEVREWVSAAVDRGK